MGGSRSARAASRTQSAPRAPASTHIRTRARTHAQASARRSRAAATTTRRAPTWLVVSACAVGVLCGAVLLAQMRGMGWRWGLALGTVALVGSGVLVLAWRRARRDANCAADIDALAALTPTEFERHVAALFGRAGYQAQHVGGAGDGGVDVRVARGRGRGIVQCKRYAPRRAVGPAIVREVVGTRAHERVDWVWIVTTGRATPGARRLAAAEHVRLLDATTSEDWMTALRTAQHGSHRHA